MTNAAAEYLLMHKETDGTVRAILEIEPELASCISMEAVDESIEWLKRYKRNCLLAEPSIIYDLKNNIGVFRPK